MSPSDCTLYKTCGGNKPRPIKCCPWMTGLRHALPKTQSATEVAEPATLSGQVWVTFLVMRLASLHYFVLQMGV